MEHISVLLNESLDALNIRENLIYVDMTLGGGGHSSCILKRLNGTGHLYCFDVDDYSILRAKEKLEATGFTNYTIIKSNFKNIKEELELLGVHKVDGILYDLGVSSFQFDMPEKGFSYNYDARLDMRMDDRLKISAWDIINKYNEKDIADILYKYGDEIYSRQIAKKIVNERNIKPINTTFELVDIIKKSLPAKELNKKGHPAKKSFQALRVEVNHELDYLSESLYKSIDLLNKGGRLAVIDFEPLEDKIVKNVFKEFYTVENIKNLPTLPEEPVLIRITKKPILPTESEIQNNRRSHSSMLRVVEKNK